MAVREPLRDLVGRLSRADAILAAVPVLFLVVYAAGVLTFEGRAIGAAAASIACGLLISDGLFWHAPTGE